MRPSVDIYEEKFIGKECQLYGKYGECIPLTFSRPSASDLCVRRHKQNVVAQEVVFHSEKKDYDFIL